MAKVKAPLLSFGASGAIAGTQVYFPWKGLNVVRKYVIPTNPDTDAQQTHRARLTEAVDKIHTAMAAPDHALDSEDKSAFSLWASVQGIIMTWFNTIAKYWIEARVAGNSACIFTDMHCTPGVDKLTVQGFITAAVGAEPTNGFLHYGTTKSSLVSKIACTVADLATGKDITTLVTGKKYYVQYRPSTPGYLESMSGIYYGVPE